MVALRRALVDEKCCSQIKCTSKLYRPYPVREVKYPLLNVKFACLGKVCNLCTPADSRRDLLLLLNLKELPASSNRHTSTANWIQCLPRVFPSAGK
jgi:hypothetical protein